MRATWITFTANESLFARKAALALEESWDFGASFFTVGEIDQDAQAFQSAQASLAQSDFAFVAGMGDLGSFKSFALLKGAFVGKIPSFIRTSQDDETAALREMSLISPAAWSRIESYRVAGGEKNALNLLSFILGEVGGLKAPSDPPDLSLWDGVYGTQDSEAVLQRAREAKREVVGVLIHRAYVLSGDTAHIDALIRSIEKTGAIALPVFSNVAPEDGAGGLNETIQKFFMHNGRPVIDSLVVTVGMSLGVLASGGAGEAPPVFMPLNVAAIQAISLYCGKEEWESSLSPLGSAGLVSGVYQPEFDGQLIGVPIAYTQECEEEGFRRTRLVPIPERVDKLARLAFNWARLKKTDPAELKIAIVLHNLPPRVDMIGCASGLDTPASLYEIAGRLSAMGVKLDYAFESGRDILDRVIAIQTNDQRFASEEELFGRCAFTLGPESYEKWHAQLGEAQKSELKERWGGMPGDFMSWQGRILVPGFANGNVFIGLQPSRESEGKAEELYHSTDSVPPPSYLAFYRFLEEEWGARCVIHLGTHGTLEWLPGKEAGLSGACYPDISIGTLPNIYPYIIDLPGEGANAKRRSYACVVDYLIPTLVEAGSYGEQEEMEGLIGGYFHASALSNASESAYEEEIWELAERSSLNVDLSLDKAAFFADPKGSIEKIHVWISGLKSSLVGDGLHVFGQAPSGPQYRDMLKCLTAVRNGNTPGLRESLALSAGLDYGDLKTRPAAADSEGVTNAMRLERLDEAGRLLFEELDGSGYTQESAQKAIAAVHGLWGGGKEAPLKEYLDFVLGQAKPRLDKTGEEMEALMRAVGGGFAWPGPSGCPTRGNAKLLPTGRNFYLVDPASIPSRASWKVGVRLGDMLLDRHRAEHGKWPESVSILVYATNTIQTGGDDLAEALYLLGIRPVWLEGTDRVISLEAIPPEELARPRIDVLLRISGLFRDTFPNLIERAEDAVNMVAALDESHESNFVRKHVDKEIEELVQSGAGALEASQTARLRIFGDPPGTYGTGIEEAIHAKAWQTPDDLADIYVNWAAHAYGAKIHGEKLARAYRRRLAEVDATVQNIPSQETDILADDDYYNYYGALIGAVASAKGSEPASYTSHTGDVDNPLLRSVHEDVSKIFRTRINNPVWINGMRRHDFKGAQAFSKTVDTVFGWDATAGAIEGWMYESIANTYLFDRDLAEWIRQVNPYALHAIAERLIEAAGRGMWEADEETLERVREAYLELDGVLEGI
jgi:cobaltochelatase CobN